jgi:hypothetical protein
MYGQIKVEFIFGIVIFAMVIFFIVTQTNTLFSSLITDAKSDSLKAKASNAIEILVGDQGDPPNWETIAQANPGNVKRVGLAYNQPYNLSRNKISSLSQNCTGTSDYYKNLLSNFNLNAYTLKIYDSTGQILICGIESTEPPAVIETRYVIIGNDFGNVTLKLW